MRRAAGRARLPAGLTVAAVVALLVLPGRADVVFHVYVLCLAAFGLAHLLAALRRSLPERHPSAIDAALEPRRPRATRIPELERLGSEVTLGLATAFDLHYRLRPTLRGIASELLRSRRGIDLDRDPTAARRALGDEAWELVRADREPPRERFGPGADIATLRTVVGSLEAL